MKLYSVPSEQAALVERLLEISRTPYPQRRGLIAALEREGYSVALTPQGPVARSGSAEYRLPRILCPSCGKLRGLAEFMTLRGVEHPWCDTCRQNDYQGAERARAERDEIWKRGETPVRANMRCANPACPNDGIIPPEKLKHHPKYCSEACRWAVRGTDRRCRDCGAALAPGQRRTRCESCHERVQQARAANTARPCANPSCPEQRQVRPPRKYCCVGCADAHRIASGFFKQMSEKDNERAHDIKEASGQIAHYANRSRRVAESNRLAPPRAKIERVASAYGQTVLLHPNGQGGYVAEVPGLPGITATHKRAKEAVRLIRAVLRERGLASRGGRAHTGESG